MLITSGNRGVAAVAASRRQVYHGCRPDSPTSRHKGTAGRKDEEAKEATADAGALLATISFPTIRSAQTLVLRLFAGRSLSFFSSRLELMKPALVATAQDAAAAANSAHILATNSNDLCDCSRSRLPVWCLRHFLFDQAVGRG